MKLDFNKWIPFLRKQLTIKRVVILASVVFILLFILFIDENSYIQQARYNKEINRLNELIEAQNDTTEHYNNLVEKLKTGNELVEQIAREQFLMSKPGEDVYIIEEASN